MAVYHPKTSTNVGTLWRTADLMGADFLCTIGRRFFYCDRKGLVMDTPTKGRLACCPDDSNLAFVAGANWQKERDAALVESIAPTEYVQRIAAVIREQSVEDDSV